MQNKKYLDVLIENNSFHFQKLILQDIDNTPVLKINHPDMAREEFCLFHRDISCGDDYFRLIHQSIEDAILKSRPIPIVRFADGEYAFYNNDLKCNGLYEQAESIASIKKSMPLHIAALRSLTSAGKIAALIFPENIGKSTGSNLSSLLHRFKKPRSSAATFINFLFQNGVDLSRQNYIPFYVVYAYLTSPAFASLMDCKNLCILNSEYNEATCRRWFDRFSSKPNISFVQIPTSYVATRWNLMKKAILQQIPSDTDICLVGAGIGALLVCVDAAAQLSCPAIDAGHVLNMMNTREEKSNGARLYTMRKS
jgi:hypothetical protein